MMSWCRLFWQPVRAAASRTFCTAGRSRPMSTAMMAITTNSSISVKAVRAFDRVRREYRDTVLTLVTGTEERVRSYPCENGDSLDYHNARMALGETGKLDWQ